MHYVTPAFDSLKSKEIFILFPSAVNLSKCMDSGKQVLITHSITTPPTHSWEELRTWLSWLFLPPSVGAQLLSGLSGKLIPHALPPQSLCLCTCSYKVPSSKPLCCEEPW